MRYFARMIQKEVVLVSYSCTMTGDENGIYFENLEPKISWVDPGAPSTSIARSNRFARKTILCVCWDQRGVVYYESLKAGEIVNTKRYQQQLTDLNHSLFEKRVRLPKEATPSHFSSITFGKTSSRHVGSTQLGGSTPFGLLTRLGSFR